MHPTAPALLATLLTATACRAWWMDDFATLDTDRWLIQLYTFDANGCNMRAENVKVADSVLRITVTRATDTTDRKWDGGDMGDQDYRTYGLFRTRMRPSTLKGSVSAFYIMNKWVETGWEHKEIDIEFVGRNPTKIQLTTHDFQDGGTVWKQDSKTVELGFDFGKAFHEYAILWRPDSVLWFADGRLLHRTGRYVPHEGLETRMNFYLGNPLQDGVVQWLGPIDSTGVPDSTEYDWVRYDPLDALPEPYRAWAPLSASRRASPARAVGGAANDPLGRRESATAAGVGLGGEGGTVRFRHPGARAIRAE